MARPPAKELTERELEIMHIFWNCGEMTASQVRDQLAGDGRDLAYTTVATLIRILGEKQFLEPTTDERPYRYRPLRSFEDVSSRLVGDLVDRVFGGSREMLMKCLMHQRRLSKKERAALEQLLREQQR